MRFYLVVILLGFPWLIDGKSRKCSYDIIIEGKAIRGDNTECFESPSPKGDVATVSGSQVDAIVVWDPDATPCHPDGSFIHYAAVGAVQTFAPMTAGAGDVVHTYHAAIFTQGLPLEPGTTGCVKDQTWSSTEKTCVKTWQVARYGSSCPPPSTLNNASKSKSATGILLVLVVLAVAVWKRQALGRWIMARIGGSNGKLQSYIALSTFATH